MSKFIIKGGKKLSGSVRISGNKNAALPIIAATLLTSEKCRLENVPEIKDVHVLLEILENLGAEVAHPENNVYEIQCAEVSKTKVPDDLAKKLRSSLLVMGPLLARFKKAEMVHPGGCVIGRRPIDAHLDAFRDLGAEIKEDQGYYTAKWPKLKEQKIFLGETSVTATENCLMAVALEEGPVTIKHAALEPHVKDLAEVLGKMGAKITNEGASYTVEGKKELSGFTHRIISDHIEAGTFSILAVASGSEITVTDCNPENLEMILVFLKRMGAKFEIGEHQVKFFPSKDLQAVRKIECGMWPSLPTDIMSPFIVLATQAKGDTLVHDWMFEGRLFFTDKLIKMGANITLCDPHRALIVGPTALHGAKLESPDLRAGIALVIAALCAEGESEIDNAYQIDRGYENIEGRLRDLGAEIERVN